MGGKKTCDQKRADTERAESVLRNVLATSIATDKAKEMRVEALGHMVAERIDQDTDTETVIDIAECMLSGFEAGYGLGKLDGFSEGRSVAAAFARLDEEAEGSEYGRFCRALAVYACKWIVDVQNMIVDHALEIFEDETLRGMVSTYAEAKEESERSRRREFVEACIGEDADKVYGDGTVIDARAKAYGQVLDDLIWDRWCRKAG